MATKLQRIMTMATLIDHSGDRCGWTANKDEYNKFLLPTDKLEKIYDSSY